MAILFIVIAFGAAIVAFFIEGGQLQGLWNLAAFIVVIGGTMGATGVSVPFENFKNMGKVALVALRGNRIDSIEILKKFQEFAFMARRHGLLALEEEAHSENLDKFLSMGLTMVVDGTDEEVIRSVLLSKTEQISKRHKTNIAMYDAAGGYAPTMGIMGTVMGLLNVLSGLGDTETLGSKIAVSFMATLYGIAAANLLFLPLASRLKSLDTKEVSQRLMIIEGLTSLSTGESPTIIMQRLKVFLSSDELQKYEASLISERGGLE